MQQNKYLQLIEQSYSKEHVKKFSKKSFNTQIESLKKLCKDVLEMLPPQPFTCAFMSAAFVEQARQEGIPAYLVAGSLAFKDKMLFRYDPIIEQKDILEKWSGHCWVILNDVIVELSLFNTIYSNQSPIWLTDLFTGFSSKQKNFMVATISEMESMELVYTPKYIFNDRKISGLLNSIEQIISKIWNIPLPDGARVACPIP
jgi:hypothetical protein